MTGRRTWLVRILLVVGGLVAGLGLIAGHLNRNVIDGPTFAAHVDDIRRDDAVATQLGQEISDRLIVRNPDLVAVRPLVQSLATDVAGSDLLSGPTQRAASTAHIALTEPGGDSVALRIVDAGAVVAAVVAAVAPERAPAAGDVSVTLLSIGNQSFAEATIAVANAIGLLTWLLPLLALVCLAAAVIVSDDRWRAATRAGWALVWAAVGVGVVLVVGGFVVRQLDVDTLGGAVGWASWQAFIRPLWWGVVALAAIGVVVVLTGGSAVPDALRAQGARVRETVRRPPRSPVGIAVRAVVVGAVGVAAIADPSGVLELAGFVAGVGLMLFAVTEIAGLAAPARVRRDAGERAAPRAPAGPGVTTFVAVAVVAVVAIVGVVALARPGADLEIVEGAPPGAGGCNGHVELCDRSFDEVAYVASHNSMSVATEPGWFIPEQIDPIRGQLDQGVRALLVDVWSGAPAGTVVRTGPGSYAEALAVTEAELGPDVVAAGQRIIASIADEPAGPEARYMCHGLCETGSTPFLETLVDIRGWLDANPDDVLTLFIEDHVDSALIADDVEAAGLLPYVHEPVDGEPWPTLGEMIEAGRRLVVMVEEGDGGADAPWLVNGFEFTQDTPYTFPTVESFSCAPNRGPSTAPLFLVNHWLSGFTSLVSSAQLVNAIDVLQPRVDECREERGQIPNFVAVNFVAIGDVYAVVDELNGVG